MTRKQIIAIDIDDVLTYTAAGWVEFTNETWGTNFSVDDYSEDWIGVWNVPLADALKRREIVFKSGVHGRFRHNRNAEPVLDEIAKKHRLIIITSRVELVRVETLEWLDKHFDGIFDKVIFTGFYDNDKPESVNVSKADILKDLGADYLIDDQLKHCIASAKAGIKCLLYGDYKWNQTNSLPAGVVRVKDWSEVGRYFDAKG